MRALKQISIICGLLALLTPGMAHGQCPFVSVSQAKATSTVIFGGVVTKQTAPLQLLLACSQASELTIRFTVHNVSTTPTAAVIGTILGNDKKYLPARLTLTVRRAGVPDATLPYIDPTGSFVAGRLDPWLITLPPDASYSVPVPAQNFRHTASLTKEPFSAPADLQLRLATREIDRTSTSSDMQGLSLIHVWVGTLTSDWVRFPSDCHPDT